MEKAHYHAARVRRPKLEPLLKSGIERIYFICQGNVCRSPFAAAYSGLWCARLTIWSAGLLAYAGKPADSTAVKAARNFQVFLENHRTRPVEIEKLLAADVVFCFEWWHVLSCRRICPQAAHKIYLLAELDGVSREVSDPFGQCEAAFTSCFTEIVRLVDILRVPLCGPIR